MAEDQDHLLELEKAIKADDSGQKKTAILQQLAEDQASVKRAIDAGAAPAEFQKLEKYNAALHAATKVVQGLGLK